MRRVPQLLVVANLPVGLRLPLAVVRASAIAWGIYPRISGMVHSAHLLENAPFRNILHSAKRISGEKRDLRFLAMVHSRIPPNRPIWAAGALSAVPFGCTIVHHFALFLHPS